MALCSLFCNLRHFLYCIILTTISAPRRPEQIQHNYTSSYHTYSGYLVHGLRQGTTPGAAVISPDPGALLREMV